MNDLAAGHPVGKTGRPGAAATHVGPVRHAKPQPRGMAPDMRLPEVATAGERLWAPVGPDARSRPIHLDLTGGFYVHLPRVRRPGVLKRHCHPRQVTIHGSLMSVDPQGVGTGYDDVFTRIENYRAHFEAVGLGADHVKEFIR